MEYLWRDASDMECMPSPCVQDGAGHYNGYRAVRVEGVDPYIEKCIRQMLAYIESADYAGWDPYDALNSPLVQRLGMHSKWVRIGATQLLRRCPFNLRPLLRVHKGHNPKGIGLFLWGYAKLYALTKAPRHLERINRLLDLLEQLRCAGYSGNCWGYDFDWQSRMFLRPKGTPTIVNTAFIGHVLLDCYQITGNVRALEMALPIKEFILNDLARIPFEETFCFSYTPVGKRAVHETEAVHNANLLGASILARLARYCDDDRLIPTALKSMDYSMRHQRNDGAWYYAETSLQKWIDSFHTGFNLEAIRYILQAGLGGKWLPAYRKGVAYYANQFFREDGAPQYYHDRVYPIDIHAPTQAICFFAGEGKQYRELTERILHWMLEHLYSGKGYFYYRRGRFFTNRISYMRWSQAWAFHALTEYAYQRSERSRRGDDSETCRTEDSGGADNVLPIASTRRNTYRRDRQAQAEDVLRGHQSGEGPSGPRRHKLSQDCSKCDTPHL